MDLQRGIWFAGLFRIFGKGDACCITYRAARMLNKDSERNTSQGPVRFILIDRNGPLADFENWEDAFRYLTVNGVQGGSILRSEQSMTELACRIDRLSGDRIPDEGGAGVRCGWSAPAEAGGL